MRTIFFTIILIYTSLMSFQTYAAKAVCTAQNTRTGQTYRVQKGSRSYSIAMKESQKAALIACLVRTNQSKNCRLTACYRR